MHATLGRAAAIFLAEHWEQLLSPHMYIYWARPHKYLRISNVAHICSLPLGSADVAPFAESLYEFLVIKQKSDYPLSEFPFISFIKWNWVSEWGLGPISSACKSSRCGRSNSKNCPSNLVIAQYPVFAAATRALAHDAWLTWRVWGWTTQRSLRWGVKLRTFAGPTSNHLTPMR